ncbi:hypothetical protein [Streptomyces sp. NPDC002763]|uniref:hypothetical protein n=1 Tax=Streptomyces sp. NPDC002763 TaxID=3154427 RepID=UPI003330E382
MQPRLWVAYATTALTVAAQFAIFSYLGALLEDVTGLSTGLVPLALGLYGVGAFIGLTVEGRVADRAPFTLLLVGIAAFNVGIAVAPLASGLVINTGLGLAGTKREPRSLQPSPSWSTLPLPPDNCRQGQRRLSVIRWRDSPGPK